MVFRIYGLVCAGMLVLFTLVNFYNMKEGGFSTELGEDIDPRNVRILQLMEAQDDNIDIVQVMESEHLAPHGVPGGFKPMARSRRNSTEEPGQAAVTQPSDPGETGGNSLNSQKHSHIYTNSEHNTYRAVQANLKLCPCPSYRRLNRFSYRNTIR